jgi:hypothetical protein
MAADDRKQSEIEAEKAKNDLFSGTSMHAFNQRFEGSHSGSIGPVDVGSPDSLDQRREEKKREERAYNQIFRHAHSILQDLDRLHKERAELVQKAKTLGIEIETNSQAIGKLSSTITTLEKYDKNMSYSQLIIENLKDNVLSADSANTLGILRNPLTDAAGNPVYIDDDGSFFILSIDPETNEPILGEDGVTPVKIQKTDPREIADFAKKITSFDDHENLVLPANYTTGAHSRFSLLHELVDVTSIKDVDATPTEKLFKIVTQPPSNTETSYVSPTIGDLKAVCDQQTNCLREENVKLGQELDQTEKDIKKTDQKIEETTSELNASQQQQKQDLYSVVPQSNLKQWLMPSKNDNAPFIGTKPATQKPLSAEQHDQMETLAKQNEAIQAKIDAAKTALSKAQTPEDAQRSQSTVSAYEQRMKEWQEENGATLKNLQEQHRAAQDSNETKETNSTVAVADGTENPALKWTSSNDAQHTITNNKAEILAAATAAGASGLSEAEIQELAENFGIPTSHIDQLQNLLAENNIQMHQNPSHTEDFNRVTGSFATSLDDNAPTLAISSNFNAHASAEQTPDAPAPKATPSLENTNNIPKAQPAVITA